MDVVHTLSHVTEQGLTLIFNPDPDVLSLTVMDVHSHRESFLPDDGKLLCSAFGRVLLSYSVSTVGFPSLVRVTRPGQRHSCRAADISADE